MLLAAFVLTATACLRGAEYDEQYTLFVTAGVARPAWPIDAFPAATVAALQAGHATFAGIAHDLRNTDVHPPLYFWLVAQWRSIVGPSLLAARLLSVLFGLGSIWLVGGIARSCAIRPWVAMLLTLGCYGFVYTNAIARGFAPAELFVLSGVALLLRRRQTITESPQGIAPPLPVMVAGGPPSSPSCPGLNKAMDRGRPSTRGRAAPTMTVVRERTTIGAVIFAGWLRRQPALAGVCLGAACGCNYLAVFPAAAVIAATGAWRAIPAALPFLLLDGWFFLAQHASRPDQFPTFELLPSVVRLVRYQVAAIFGGLPLYLDGAGRDLVAAALGLVTIVLVLSIVRATPHRWALLAGAVGTPVGLLLLGAVFDNTPIELRYLSFGVPFVALLAAASVGYRMLALILAIQFAGIAGLMLSPRTMQPAGAAAAAASSLAADTIVLVPAGNDGVGIVGAFGIEAPPTLSLLLIHPGDPIAARLTPYRRVALAALTQDRDSTTSAAAARAVLTAPAWHPVALGSNLEVYERSD